MRVDWYGQAAFRLSGQDGAVFIDPFGDVSPLAARGVQFEYPPIEGVEAEPVLLGLDQHGVAVHSGSSCSSETLEPSPVLAAMGVDADRSLRPSVGWDTTGADVAAFTAAFAEVVGKLRALAGG